MKTFERVCLVAGVLLFGALLYRVGLETLTHSLRQIGWGFAWILTQHLVALALNTLAWRSAIPRSERPPFPALLRILVAADGFNAVAPSAVIGGELIRVSLLRRTVAGTTAAASVLLAAGMQFFAQVLFILMGAPLLLGSLHRPFRNTLLALLAIFSFVLVGALALARLGDTFQRLRRLLDRFGLGRKGWLPEESAWRSLDEQIAGAFRKRPGDLVVSVILFLLGWASGAIEIYLLLLFLGSPAGWGLCLTIEVLSTLIDGVFFFVPAKIGTQEAGKYAIFLFLGLDPAVGFAVGVARRLRETVWAGIGLALLGFFQRAGRIQAAISRPAAP
jgi:uncharacterized protein (TIRG00374 family)